MTLARVPVFTEVPTFVDEQIVTADLLNTYVRDNERTLQRWWARKTADETVTSGTMQDDDQLRVAIGGGYTWHWRCFLAYSGGVGEASVLRATFSFNGTFSTMVQSSLGVLNTAGAPQLSSRFNFDETFQPFSFGSDATVRCAWIGGVVYNVSVGGMLKLRWTPSFGSMTVKANSSLMAFAMPTPGVIPPA